jgi:LuxR family transcriptional regulator, maltose regulon positive regulatory protein
LSEARATRPYLRGKIMPPEQTPGLLPREQLVSQLEASARQKLLMLVVAPAGYGKTALLGALYDRLTGSGREVRWYNCDRTDVVPQRLAAFLAALGTSRPEHDADASMGLGSFLSAANAIASHLEHHRHHLTIVLENYHLAQSPETDALVEAALEIGSPYLHLVVSSRANPSFAWRKLKLNGHVGELRVGDLALTESEIGILARQILPYFGANDLAAVWRRTEGWPLAVRLFLLALKNGADTRRLIEEIEAREADVAEYLAEEVLGAQAADVQDFLVATSMLEQFNASLSAALQPEIDTEDMIATLERESLFITNIEAGSGWFRYHPIFRQYLSSRFARLPKLRQAELRRCAMRWFEAEGYMPQAVEVALQLGDTTLAHELLVRLAPELVSLKGDLATFLRLLGRMPRNVLDDLTLRYWQAWAMFFSRRYLEAARLVTDLHRRLEQDETAKLDPEVGARLGLLDTLAATFTDDMASARAAGNRWLSHVIDARPIDRSTVANCVALAELAHHDVRTARRTLEVSQRAMAHSNSLYGASWVACIGMATDLVAGEPALAIARAQALGERMPDKSRGPFNILSTIALIAAAAEYHRNNISEASRLLHAGLPMLTEYGTSETAAFGLTACLRLTALQKGVGEALTMAQKLEPALARSYAPRLQVTLQYERALILFRANRTDDALEAASLIAEIQSIGDLVGDNPEIEMPCIRELRQLVAARAAIAEQTWNEALRILANLITNARQTGRNLRLVQALIMKASVQFAQSDLTRGARTFLEAIEIAEPRGLIRIFLDDAYICRPLISAVLSAPNNANNDQRRLHEFLLRIQKELGGEVLGRGPAEFSAPLEPLTPRERTMLNMLCAGLRNRQIAAQLSMSEATVKWHLNNLYSKLGVNNRTAAIHRGRIMGLA